MKLTKEMNSNILKYNNWLMANKVIILENSEEEKCVMFNMSDEFKPLYNAIYENLDNIKGFEIEGIQLKRLKKLMKEKEKEMKFYTLPMNDWNNIYEYQFKKYGHNNFTTAESYKLYDEMKVERNKPILLEIPHL